MFDQPQLLLLILCPALLIVAALKDVTTYTIPNWISLALIAGFFPTALALGLSGSAIGLHAAIGDRQSTRLNSSHVSESRMPSSA